MLTAHLISALLGGLVLVLRILMLKICCVVLPVLSYFVIYTCVEQMF